MYTLLLVLMNAARGERSLGSRTLHALIIDLRPPGACLFNQIPADAIPPRQTVRRRHASTRLTSSPCPQGIIPTTTAVWKHTGTRKFYGCQFHARHGIEENRTGSCVLGLLAGNESAKRYLLDTLWNWHEIDKIILGSDFTYVFLCM